MSEQQNILCSPFFPSFFFLVFFTAFQVQYRAILHQRRTNIFSLDFYILTNNLIHQIQDKFIANVDTIFYRCLKIYVIISLRLQENLFIKRKPAIELKSKV